MQNQVSESNKTFEASEIKNWIIAIPSITRFTFFFYKEIIIKK